MYEVVWRNDRGYQEGRNALTWDEVTELIQRLEDKGVFEWAIVPWNV